MTAHHMAGVVVLLDVVVELVVVVVVTELVAVLVAVLVVVELLVVLVVTVELVVLELVLTVLVMVEVTEVVLLLVLVLVPVPVPVVEVMEVVVVLVAVVVSVVVVGGLKGKDGPCSQYHLACAAPCASLAVLGPLPFRTCSIWPRPLRNTPYGDSSEFSSHFGTAMPVRTVTSWSRK
mmetsp:Transcript_4205/g.12330  ORF Transcript_4205/g.12330 Transcript_4205/m.12330 type:complete len:177 (-) Transcript_4205:1515-2045(-)